MIASNFVFPAMLIVNVPFLFVFFQDIRAALLAVPEGRSLVENLDKDQLITTKERRAMVRILVSHLIEKSGET